MSAVLTSGLQTRGAECAGAVVWKIAAAMDSVWHACCDVARVLGFIRKEKVREILREVVFFAGFAACCAAGAIAPTPRADGEIGLREVQ